jgi:hypothetical protein
MRMCLVPIVGLQMLLVRNKDATVLVLCFYLVVGWTISTFNSIPVPSCPFS